MRINVGYTFNQNLNLFLSNLCLPTPVSLNFKVNFFLIAFVISSINAGKILVLFLKMYNKIKSYFKDMHCFISKKNTKKCEYLILGQVAYCTGHPVLQPSQAQCRPFQQ